MESEGEIFSVCVVIHYLEVKLIVFSYSQQITYCIYEYQNNEIIRTVAKMNHTEYDSKSMKR